MSNTIQHLDLGRVYDLLMRQKAVDAQVAGQQQQGQMNALQMARYQRENDEYDRKQSALAIFNDPNATPEQQQSALRVAYPEMFAQSVLTPKGETQVVVPSGGAVYDRRTGQWTYPDQGPVLEGDPARGSQPPQQPRPTITTGGHGPVPVPERRPATEGGTTGDVAEAGIRLWETGGNPNPNTARNPNSTASGTHQFTEGTWLEMLQKYAPGVIETTVGKGANLNDPNVRAALVRLREDPQLSHDMAVSYADENGNALQERGIEATPRNKLVAHFLGAGGATRFLSADPDAPAVSAVSPGAASANKRIFYKEDGSPRTVREVLAMADDTIARAQQQAGGQPPSAPPEGAPPNAPQQSDDGWKRIQAGGLKSLGLQDAPTGKMWVGRRNPNTGQIETKVVPIPGTETEDDFGKGEDAANYRVYRRLSAKQARGETLTEDEQMDLDFSVRQLTQPRVVTGPDGKTREIVPPPLPTRGSKPQGQQVQGQPAPQPATQPGTSTVREIDTQPVGPSTAERKTINDQLSVVDRFDGALRALAEDVGTNGLSLFAVGGGGGRQSSLYKDVLLQLKELQNLGVLNGGDERILLEQLSDPTALMTWIRGGGDPSYFKEQLKAVQEKVARERGLLKGRLNPGQSTTAGDMDFGSMSRKDLLALDTDTMSVDQINAWHAALDSAKGK